MLTLSDNSQTESQFIICALKLPKTILEPSSLQTYHIFDSEFFCSNFAIHNGEIQVPSETLGIATMDVI